MTTLLLVIIVFLLVAILLVQRTTPPDCYEEQLEAWRAEDERLARKEAFWRAVANGFRKVGL